MLVTLIAVLISLIINTCKPTKDYLSVLDDQPQTSVAGTGNVRNTSEINTDLTLSLQQQTHPDPHHGTINKPIGGALTRAQRRLENVKKDPIRYEEYLVKKRARNNKWRKKSSATATAPNLSPEDALILKAKKSVYRSKTYIKQMQKYGGTGLKHRFELERLREKVKAGLGNEADAKRVEDADRIRKEKKSIENHKSYLKRKAKKERTNA